MSILKWNNVDFKFTLISIIKGSCDFFIFPVQIRVITENIQGFSLESERVTHDLYVLKLSYRSKVISIKLLLNSGYFL